MFPTCSFYVEDTAHVCFKNSSGGRWGGDIGEGRGNKRKHVCSSTHANSHGEVTDWRPFEKNASCTPAKIVSCSNPAPATPHPATCYLPRLPLIILNELMFISCPLIKKKKKYSLIRPKRRQYMI
jgi:hypothetical protein